MTKLNTLIAYLLPLIGGGKIVFDLYKENQFLKEEIVNYQSTIYQTQEKLIQIEKNVQTSLQNNEVILQQINESVNSTSSLLNISTDKIIIGLVIVTAIIIFATLNSPSNSTIQQLSKQGSLEAGEIFRENIVTTALAGMNETNKLSSKHTIILNTKMDQLETNLLVKIEESQNEIMHHLITKLPLDIINLQTGCNSELNSPFNNLQSTMGESLMTVPGENAIQNIISSNRDLNIIPGTIQNDVTQFISDMSPYISAFDGSVPGSF